MKTFIPILLILLIASQDLVAQHASMKDSLMHAKDTIILKTGKQYDSIQNAKNSKIDSLDIINRRLQEQINNVTNLNFLNEIEQDFSKQDHKAFSQNDSVKIKLKSKIDSLNAHGFSSEQFTKTLDSINQRIPLNHIEEVESKVSLKVNDKINKPVDGVNGKLNQLTSEAQGNGNLPSNINNPLGDKNLIPGTPDIDIKSNSSTIPTDKLSTNANSNVSSKASSIDEISKGKDGLNEISKESERLSNYAEDVKAIRTGDPKNVKQIDKDIVKKISNDEIEAAQSEIITANGKMEELKSLESKRHYFKKQTLEKSRALVARQVALQQDKITKSVEKISKYQKRVSAISGKVKGLPKRAEKAKKPPVIERFVPGLTFQVQKLNFLFVDFNPTVRYRVNSIFSAGIGWNERIAFDKDVNFYKAYRMYGVRSFYELGVLKGLSLRGDIEYMNAFVPINRSQMDMGERKQVWSCMAGIKKDFSFLKGIIGNVQFMYNLYDPKRTGPYFNRLNVRFGFEFPLRKKMQTKT